jgi:hypothetical protein
MTPPPQLVPPPAFPPAPKIDGMHASFTPPPATMNMMEYAANMFKEAQKIHEETREYSNHIRQESQRYFGEISRMRDSVLRMYASHNTRCAQWEVVSAYRGTRELSEALATGFKPFQVDADGQHHLRKCKRRSFPEIPVLRK